MFKSHIGFAIVLCCLFSMHIKAQYSDPVFNRLTIQEGLPENTIQCLIQDKQGYIWMGTQAGIVRYNGYDTKLYNFGKELTHDAYTPTLFEDRSGMIWAGTAYRGLLYYDRITDRYIPYQPAAGERIRNNLIVQIADDRKNNIILITMDPDTKTCSLERINLGSGKVDHYSYSEKGTHHINATIFSEMLVAKNGKIWLATNNGIYEYDAVKDAFSGHLVSADPAKQKRYSSLLEDPSQPGVLWMCQSNDTRSVIPERRYSGNEGVLQYNSNKELPTYYRHTDNNSSIANDSIYGIKKDQQNRIWFAAANGLFLFNPLQKNFINYKLPAKSVDRTLPLDITFQPDDKGNIWYGGRAGIRCFDTRSNRFNNFNNREKLPGKDGDISVILLDRNNSVWIGTYFSGLYWIDKRASNYTFITKDNKKQGGYPGGWTCSFSEAKDRSVWIANENGLYHWYPEPDSFELIRLDPSIAKLTGISVLLDSKGRTWFSTGGYGIYCYDTVTKKTLHYAYDGNDNNSISSNNGGALFEDSKGRIWIGTWGAGICLWRPETNDFKRYPYNGFENAGNVSHNGELDDDEVCLIFEDGTHHIWVGTNNGGLNRLDESTDHFTSYCNNPPGFDCTISAVPVDADKYYIGTFMNGLFLFDTKAGTAKRITETDGLLYNGSRTLLKDEYENVWSGSIRGFNIIQPGSKEFRKISRSSGFPDIEFGYPTQNIKTQTGKFLIGCINGILVFDPADFKPDTLAPLVHIEQLSFSNPLKKREEGDSVLLLNGKREIHLNYDENKVSFFYTALSFQQASLNQYRVWLDGYEKNWVEMGTQRVATYNNLSPGTYVFHVMAANSDGTWTKTDETFTVIISPPWWHTWWAYGCYGIIAVLIVWTYTRYRVAGIKKEKEVLETRVTDRTKELTLAQNRIEMQSLRSQLNPHFMFNSLNAIQELILLEENDKSHSYLARFAKLLRMLLENTERLFIPLQKEIEFVQLYLSLEQLRIPELKFDIQVDDGIDREQTLIPNMILQPYLENAIWHGLSHKTSDKKLQLRITRANGAVQYEIEDNGVGRKRSAELKSLFRREHKSKGMELLSRRFKLLSKELGSDIIVDYEDVMNNGEVAGTIVKIKVPNSFL